MTDYTKLIEALRCNGTSMNGSCVGKKCGYYADGFCESMRMHTDAAAAIEALQDTVQAQDKALKECARQLAKMGPKRGEWVEDTTTYAGPGLSNYKCSLCGKICGTWRRGLKPSELPNWCGNCGARMEVQDAD